MTARLMLSVGMFKAFAALMAVLNRGLPSGSPPPKRAAIVISLISFVKARPRFASIAPFLCLILCHFEWPDIGLSLNRQIAFSLTNAMKKRQGDQPRRSARSWFLFLRILRFRSESGSFLRLLNPSAGR